MFNIIKVSLIGILFSSLCFADLPQSKQVEPSTGITTWQITQSGINFSLTQILPEQAKAFFINRGFNLQQTQAFASSCVYMTILRNDTAPGVVHYNKSQWSIYVNKELHPLVSTDAWIKKLKEQGVGDKELLAFRWAQFPTEQEYEPGGDWNQGMLSIGLPAGSSFDMTVRWDVGGKKFETALQEVQCAK